MGACGAPTAGVLVMVGLCLAAAVSASDVPAFFYNVTYPSSAELRWVAGALGEFVSDMTNPSINMLGLANYSLVSENKQVAFDVFWNTKDSTSTSTMNNYLDNYAMPNLTVPSARGIVSNVRQDMNHADSIGVSDNLGEEASAQIFPLNNRNPFACGLGSSFKFAATQEAFNNLCQNCLAADTLAAGFGIAFLEHGNLNGLPSPRMWPGRAAMIPVRDKNEFPEIAHPQGQEYFARALHWAGDLNDAPMITATAPWTFDKFVVGEKNFSDSANLTVVLSHFDYRDLDIGRGYCVYPGLVVIELVVPANSAWQYRETPSSNWSNIPANVSDANAFTLASEHEIRLAAGMETGIAILRFRGWDATSVENPSATQVLTTINITDKHGGEYASSTDIGELRVDINPPAPVTTAPVTTGVFVPPGSTTRAATSSGSTGNPSSSQSTSSTTDSQTASTTTLSSSSAGATQSIGAPVAPGPGASSSGGDLLFVWVIVAVVAVCILFLAAGFYIWRRRQADGTEMHSSSSAGPVDSAEIEVETYGSVKDILQENSSGSSASSSEEVVYAGLGSFKDANA